MLRRVLRDLWGTRAATRPDHPDPELRSRRWKQPRERVWSAARALADGGLDGWSVVEADPSNRVIRAEARTPILSFIDDVEIRIRQDGPSVVVDVESRSRLGVTDLGANPRRVRRFLGELSDRLRAG